MLADICSGSIINRNRTILSLLQNNIKLFSNALDHGFTVYTAHALHNITAAPCPPPAHSAVHDFSNDRLPYIELS